jgi:spore maturation protein CgeB
MPNGYHDYYTSDRVFIAVASGVPFVDHWLPGVDQILKPDRDWWLAHNIKEMFTLCDTLLEMPNSDRVCWGQVARERILAHHTQYHRCAEMIEIVSTLREARLSGHNAAKPELRFLFDSRDAGTTPDSIVGWDG